MFILKPQTEITIAVNESHVMLYETLIAVGGSIKNIRGMSDGTITYGLNYQFLTTSSQLPKLSINFGLWWFMAR